MTAHNPDTQIYALDAWFPEANTALPVKREHKARRSLFKLGHAALWNSGVGVALTTTMVMYDRIGHTDQLHDANHYTFYASAAVASLGTLMTGGGLLFNYISNRADTRLQPTAKLKLQNSETVQPASIEINPFDAFQQKYQLAVKPGSYTEQNAQVYRMVTPEQQQRMMDLMAYERAELSSRLEQPQVAPIASN